MKLQGNVKGAVYPVEQQAYDKPIDATRACGYCGRKFVYDPITRLKAYCSHECKHQAHLESSKRSYRRRKARGAV